MLGPQPPDLVEWWKYPRVVVPLPEEMRVVPPAAWAEKQGASKGNGTFDLW
jgi:hypothetical protein